MPNSIQSNINIGDEISWVSNYDGLIHTSEVCALDEDGNYCVYVDYAGGQDRIPHSDVIKVDGRKKEI